HWFHPIHAFAPNDPNAHRESKYFLTFDAGLEEALLRDRATEQQLPTQLPATDPRLRLQHQNKADMHYVIGCAALSHGHV
ncbi:hypothetical protein IMZ48_16405, partial [Candidatus Bathyarchaeota archaeon]|nr:hypothetical protein [Candidatus Bathyarchaeota archaeon]